MFLVCVVGMFKGCKKLKQIPDISNWNTSLLEDMRNMFKDCESLEKMPPIADWTIPELYSDFGIFDGCKFAKE